MGFRITIKVDGSKELCISKWEGNIMRELKFRAWSKTSKEYNYKVLVGNNNPKDKNYTCNSILSDGKWLHFDEFCGDIEQYTGLKDKNGTEIYEGDICSFFTKNGKCVGVVEWLDDLASFGLRMAKNNFLYTFSELNIMRVDLDTLEVAGNIHENPELLKCNENPEKFNNYKGDVKK